MELSAATKIGAIAKNRSKEADPKRFLMWKHHTMHHPEEQNFGKKLAIKPKTKTGFLALDTAKIESLMKKTEDFPQVLAFLLDSEEKSTERGK